MENVSIKPEVLRSSANEMKSKVDLMRGNLETASNVMNQTSESFESSAAEALRAKYNELKPKFESFYNEMLSYAEFLEKTANLYDQTNQSIEAAAKELI